MFHEPSPRPCNPQQHSPRIVLAPKAAPHANNAHTYAHSHPHSHAQKPQPPSPSTSTMTSLHPRYTPSSARGAYTTSPPPLFHPQPQRPAQSQMINPPPLMTHSTSYGCPSSSSSSFPLTPKTTANSRPKPTKKVSSSTTSKHKNVQDRLEVKVERAKGFHAFFVPLARTLPPAPPSSPVFGQRAQCPAGATGGIGGDDDYFEGWDKRKVGRREQWVEDVSGEEDSGMEVDSE